MTDEETKQLYNDFIHKTLYEDLSIDDYYLVMDSMGIPYKNGHMFKTACHNVELHDAKYALSLHNKSFTCFSECGCSYSLLSIVKKRFELIGEPKKSMQCMKYICDVCNIPFDFNITDKPIKKIEYNWKKTLGKYDKGIVREDEEDVIIDKSILSLFPKIYHQSWIDDNISIETMEKYGIRFYIYGDAIVIPCFNIDGKLIGIRCRCLNPNAEHKYYPLRLINSKTYNFATNNSLYGLWYTKHSISRHRKCVICESEKGVLQLETFYGSDNFSVALYGKAMSDKKKMLLLQLGITELVIGLDWDFDSIFELDGETKTVDFLKYMKGVIKIYEIFAPFVIVTLLLSDGSHKRNQSPSDYSKVKFEWIYDNRFTISKDKDKYILTHKDGYSIMIKREEL